jgi:hypothetical protein
MQAHITVLVKCAGSEGVEAGRKLAALHVLQSGLSAPGHSKAQVTMTAGSPGTVIRY